MLLYLSSYFRACADIDHDENGDGRNRGTVATALAAVFPRTDTHAGRGATSVPGSRAHRLKWAGRCQA